MAPEHISFTWVVLTQQIIWAVFTFTALPEEYFQPLQQVLNNSLIILHVQGSPLQDLQRSLGFFPAYIFGITADSRACNVIGTWPCSTCRQVFWIWTFFCFTFLVVKRPQMNSKAGHGTWKQKPDNISSLSRRAPFTFKETQSQAW